MRRILRRLSVATVLCTVPVSASGQGRTGRGPANLEGTWNSATPTPLDRPRDFGDDPTTFVQPWKGELTLGRSAGNIYEYACHEGNYAMEGMLRGARATEEGEPGR